MNKVNLAIALGLIHKDRLAVYKKLNKLRNNYAHNLHFSINDKDIDDLLNSMPSGIKEGYTIGHRVFNSGDGLSARPKNLINLSVVIMIIWFGVLQIGVQNKKSNCIKVLKDTMNILSLKDNFPTDQELMERVNLTIQELLDSVSLETFNN